MVPEHEDQIDRFRYPHLVDTHHHSVRMQWLQMYLIQIVLLDWLFLHYIMTLHLHSFSV